MKVRTISTNNYRPNKPSFNGVYSNKGTVFSESQLKTIENIKTTLGDKKDTNDFFVSSGNIKDSVSLSKVIGLKSIGVGIDSDEVTWTAEYEVGTYNEENPFKIEDLKKADKKEASNILYQISLLAIPIAGFLFCLFTNPKATIGYNQKPKTELIQKADTLIQKADTLKTSFIK